MPPNPRLLLLSLLLGAESQGDAGLGARELLAAGALFGHSGNTLRVALARAAAAGLLATPRRGFYTLGPAARPLAREVGRWRQLPEQARPWDGGWIAVHVGAAGRSDRAALRARERAFGLLGLAAFERGLHLRPDNLDGGADGLRARLQALLPDGTEAGTVFALHGLAPGDDRRARGLWDGAALDAAYRAGTAELTAWLDGAATLSPDRAAREAFALGHAAIRRIVYDPWLPAPLVDEAARRRFVATVLRHDEAGKRLWRRFLAAAREGTPLETPA